MTRDWFSSALFLAAMCLRRRLLLLTAHGCVFRMSRSLCNFRKLVLRSADEMPLSHFLNQVSLRLLKWSVPPIDRIILFRYECNDWTSTALKGEFHCTDKRLKPQGRRLRLKLYNLVVRHKVYSLSFGGHPCNHGVRVRDCAPLKASEWTICTPNTKTCTGFANMFEHIWTLRSETPRENQLTSTSVCNTDTDLGHVPLVLDNHFFG